MKKAISLFLVLALTFCFVLPVSADTTVTCEKVTLKLTLTETDNLQQSIVRFNLFAEDGTFLYNAYTEVQPGAPELTVDFPVGPFDAGQKFLLCMTEGAEALAYYDKTYLPGENIALSTYADGDVLGDTFHMSLDPYTAPSVQIDKLNIHLTLTDTADLQYQTVRFNLFNAQEVFLYNAFAEIKPGTKEVVVTFPVGPFNAGEQFILRLTEGVKAVQYYADEYMAGEAILLSTYAYTDESGNLIKSDTFHLSADPYTALDTFKTTAEQFVNEKGYTSKTDYLIWVSKSNYRVTLFKKGENGWNYRDSFKCTIGAPGSPTVTGEFEYYQYQPKWYYADFWCGPVMRFYGGYALHSTLIRYNGSAYDARLGVMASHGCVRLAPEAINWLVDVTPMHTAIVVTQ